MDHDVAAGEMDKLKKNILWQNRWRQIRQEGAGDFGAIRGDGWSMTVCAKMCIPQEDEKKQEMKILTMHED